MCALEMAALGIQGNGGEGSSHISAESIKSTLEGLENPLQRDFIAQCIQSDPKLRPTARELLFHGVLFEVHSLQLLAAHTFINSLSNLPENMTDEALMQKKEPNNVVAEIIYKNKPGEPVQWKLSQCPPLDLEKFLEDVRNGIYPLTAFAMPRAPPSRPRVKTPEVEESEKIDDPEPVDVESRLVTSMSCQVKKMEESSNSFQINIYLKMDDKMNRQLQAEVTETDTATALAQELVHYGFINESDREKIAKLIEDSLNPNMLQNESSPPVAMSVS